MFKIGFIGSGNMAEAIIKGLLAKNVVPAENIIVSDIDTKKLSALSQQTGILCAKSNEEVIEKSDYVVLAIKPHIYKGALKELQALIKEKNPVLISIAAGTDLETIKGYLGGLETSVVRVMPNVNVAVLEGMSALCPNEYAQDTHIKVVETIFSSIGKTVTIPESQFGVYSGIAGCSPAFTYMFIEGLAKAGLKGGLTKEQAQLIATQAVLGSAKNLIESGNHPMVMVDKVTSPGGTTIAGVAKLEEKALISTMIQAVEATIARDMEIQDNNRK